MLAEREIIEKLTNFLPLKVHYPEDLCCAYVGRVHVYVNGRVERNL